MRLRTKGEEGGEKQNWKYLLEVTKARPERGRAGCSSSWPQREEQLLFPSDMDLHDVSVKLIFGLGH